jgi:hypothetical protein
MMNANNEAFHYDMWLLKRGSPEHRATASKRRKAIIAQTQCAVQSQLPRVSCVGYLLLYSEFLVNSPVITVAK